MRGENECRGSLLRVRQWVGLEGNMQYHAMASLYLWQVFIFANIYRSEQVVSKLGNS